MPKKLTNLEKLLAQPDLVVPIVTVVLFSLFFAWNFAFRTGGVVSVSSTQSSSSSSRSLTKRRILTEPMSQNLAFEENTLNHILITGQSLSVGETGKPALSIFQPYSNLRLTDGIVEPLIENIQLDGYTETSESITSGFANNTTFNSKDQKYQIVISNHGRGGTAYNNLKKGTALYQKNLDEVSAAQSLAKGKGLKHKVRAVFVIHGESDNALGNGSKYADFLQEWHTAYNQDIKQITGQTEDIFLFTDQMSSFGHVLATPKNIADPSTALAQLTASEKNPKIIMVGPKYFLNYNDNLNLNNLGYRKMGEYYAKAFQQTVLKNENWQPLKPLETRLEGDKIKIRFSVPQKPLTLDTKNVLERENYGFNFVEDDGNPGKIQSVKLISEDTIEITLDKIPSGNNKKIQYGLNAAYLNDSTTGHGTGAMRTGTAGGNLRDNDESDSIYGNNLYNWAVHFEESLD